MAVIAANVTDETVDLIQDVLASDEFTQFTQKNKINLADNTILLRLALINLIKHLPKGDEIIQFKPALLRPSEFDDFLREKLGVVDHVH